MIFVILFFVHINTINAQEIPEDRFDFISELKPRFGLMNIEIDNLYENPIRTEAALIFTILLHTYEGDIHRMRGAIHNQIIFDDYGHEAVFEFELDENGLPIEGTSSELTITNCMNMANYNYFHQKEYPLAHFAVDILPWLLEGNCGNDPTSIAERIDAYVLDFQRGMESIIKTESGYYHPKFIDGINNGQLEALSFLIKALELGGFNRNELTLSNFGNENVRLMLRTALEIGLKEMLVEA